jgi:hypothetical protein
MKKSLIFLFLGIFLISFVAAQHKIEVIPTQEAFEAGESITLRVSLLDSDNNPVYDEVTVILEDSSKNKIEKIVNSNELVSIDLGETAAFGQGVITAKYQDAISTGIFFINANENIDFELSEDTLIITNTGNTRYVKPFQIVIGEYVGETQEFDLEIGESKSFTLVAPEGTYVLKVIVDGEVLFSKNDVPLKGKGFTGEAIGAIDDSSSKRSGLTGGISPDEGSHEAVLGYLKNNKLTYVFVFVIFGTMILLAIERRYRKKIKK